MKHTPGPWKLEAGRNIVTESGTFYITYGKDNHKNPLWLSSFSELDDNARLIASAPSMYDMLKDAVSMLGVLTGDNLAVYARTFSALASELIARAESSHV